MKQTNRLIYSVGLLLLCYSSIYANTATWLIEKQKTIQKSAPLNKQSEVVIDNQHGDVVVGIWERKEVKVVVTIKANGTSDEKALEYLEDASVEEYKENNRIVYKTVINSKNSNWSSLKSLSQSGKNYLRIDYHVMLPSQTTLAIQNKFGAIKVPNYEGQLSIDSRYGSFKGGELLHTNNTVKVSYGNGDIILLSGGILDIRYSNFAVAKMGEVQLQNKYGKLEIGEVKDLIGSIDYSGVSIGKITSSGVVKVNYSGKFKITESKAELLDIKAAYSTIELPVMPAEYAVSVSYGNFKYPTNKEFMIKQSAASAQASKQTKTYEGYIGARPNAHQVKVISRFGDVRLVE